MENMSTGKERKFLGVFQDDRMHFKERSIDTRVIFKKYA